MVRKNSKISASNSPKTYINRKYDAYEMTDVFYSPLDGIIYLYVYYKNYVYYEPEKIYHRG